MKSIVDDIITKLQTNNFDACVNCKEVDNCNLGLYCISAIKGILSGNKWEAKYPVSAIKK